MMNNSYIAKIPHAVAVLDDFGVIGEANRRLHDLNGFDMDRPEGQAGEFSMHYQPIVDLLSTEVIGFEALMRWRHPEHGWVSPNIFIPLAERNDLIYKLSAFTLTEATQAASCWNHPIDQVRNPYVAVNLSTRQFHDPALIPTIEQALIDCDLSLERLVIEITESAMLMDVTDTVEVISRLRELGIGISLGQVGSHHASLSYLAFLQPRIIKLDRQLITNAHDDAHSEGLIEEVVALGRDLNTTVLAERMETPQQFAAFQELGCDQGQGFLFSPAVTAIEAEGLAGRIIGS